MSTRKSQAIQTALEGDWDAAITLNEQVLDEDPNDIDTLNRIAFAYLSLGKPKNAKEYYEKVLALDMQNPIALRNIKRLSNGQTKKIVIPLNNLFIEEPGKTKIMELLNVADKKFLTDLRSGELVHLRIKRNKIFVQNTENQYLGMLPEDVGQRLIKFMNAGNQYEAYVRNVNNNKLCVFIREIKRMKRFKDQPSFVSTEKAKLELDKKSHRASR